MHKFKYPRLKSRRKARNFNRTTAALPPIVEETLSWLEEHHAWNTEGLFRISGDMREIKQIAKKYEKGKKVNLDEEATGMREHTIAGVFKFYLRELPSPLLTFELYETFLSAMSVPDEKSRLELIKTTSNLLPPGNKSLLVRLIGFLKEVAEHSNVNKMSCNNLAIVFSPVLLRPEHDELMAQLKDGDIAQKLLVTMIENHHFLFVQELDQEEAARKLLQTSGEHKAFYRTLKKGTLRLAASLVQERKLLEQLQQEAAESALTEHEKEQEEKDLIEKEEKEISCEQPSVCVVPSKQQQPHEEQNQPVVPSINMRAVNHNIKKADEKHERDPQRVSIDEKDPSQKKAAQRKLLSPRKLLNKDKKGKKVERKTSNLYDKAKERERERERKEMMALMTMDAWEIEATSPREHTENLSDLSDDYKLDISDEGMQTYQQRFIRELHKENIIDTEETGKPNLLEDREETNMDKPADVVEELDISIGKEHDPKSDQTTEHEKQHSAQASPRFLSSSAPVYGTLHINQNPSLDENSTTDEECTLSRADETATNKTTGDAVTPDNLRDNQKEDKRATRHEDARPRSATLRLSKEAVRQQQQKQLPPVPVGASSPSVPTHQRSRSLVTPPSSPSLISDLISSQSTFKKPLPITKHMAALPPLPASHCPTSPALSPRTRKPLPPTPPASPSTSQNATKPLPPTPSPRTAANPDVNSAPHKAIPEQKLPPVPLRHSHGNIIPSSPSPSSSSNFGSLPSSFQSSKQNNRPISFPTSPLPKPTVPLRPPPSSIFAPSPGSPLKDKAEDKEKALATPSPVIDGSSTQTVQRPESAEHNNSNDHHHQEVSQGSVSSGSGVNNSNSNSNVVEVDGESESDDEEQMEAWSKFIASGNISYFEEFVTANYDLTDLVRDLDVSKLDHYQ